MKTYEKTISKKSAILFALANLVSFLVYYITSYTLPGKASVYIFYYWSELVSTVLPLLAAVSLLITYSVRGINFSLLRSLLYSLTWLINLFPYYAFEYAYDGLEITGVITFAAIHSVFMLIVTYLEITVLFLLMLFAIKKTAGARGERRSIGELLSEKSALDLSAPSSVGLFAGAMAMFIYNLAFEIYDTVSFLIEVEGYYQSGEIIYIVFRYIFILLMLIVSYLAQIIFKNRFLKTKS